ncbi:alkaline phosphatase family protein [Aneurinibacillus sp. Ricciae_BoGa-3]|uniref:alkaline phosphatase family protein n=1 Tax=Aneurinibacillus sp. Ricciae_BoGa-3 TaxID=3022697 RepID=UPI0023400988|nr:alkaline phosphatase family protein [Aneurinibacillus sp. Ricciae_BoGa-3]WCK55698.1 alkaline phosphatase family protein [Aneurinibacillus sp. Ricciae_BoGa-3]
MNKKVILIVIDSFMPHVFQEARQKKLVPALSRLADEGTYWDNCVTVFPTMSASADCSLIAGCYPDEHMVPGLMWYNPREQTVVNYINGNKAVIRQGLSRCAENVLIDLNEKHMSRQVTTLFEELERSGKSAASINLAAHRADEKHLLYKPGLMKLVLGKVRDQMVSGPRVCSLGIFIRSYGRPFPWSFNQSFLKKYGMNDSFAVDIVCRMIKENQLPDFTGIYLPDTDYYYHRKPEQGAALLGKVDKQVTRLIDALGGWDEALRKCAFIITGDHGQTKIKSVKESGIQLEPFFRNLKISPKGNVNPKQDDLVICNNERMCYIYPFKEGIKEEVIRLLSPDERIDIVAWKEQGGVYIRNSHAKLYFSPVEQDKAQDESRVVLDPFGRAWRIKGNIGVIDGVIKRPDSGVPTLTFGSYPDVFSRLYGALYANEAPCIVITSAPGYEFVTKYDPVHQGGASHGSLHATDSLVPLIITGSEPLDSSSPRIVELKKYIYNLLC